MNQIEYFNELNKACAVLKLKKSNITISHGGASLVHGLKDQTEDIDVSIDQASYDKLKASGLEHRIIPATGNTPEWECVAYGNIDFHADRPEQSNLKTSIYRGYKVTTKLQLLMDRIDLGREKDIPDIVALKQYYDLLDAKYKQRLKKLLGDKYNPN